MRYITILYSRLDHECRPAADNHHYIGATPDFQAIDWTTSPMRILKKHLLLFALMASLLAAASSAGDAPLQLASLGQDSRDNHRTASSPWQALNPRKLQLKSATALVVDRFGNEVYAKQVDTPMPIASITKLMTAMVILDAGQPLQERITITREDRDRGSRPHPQHGIAPGLRRHADPETTAATDADGLGKPRGQRSRPQLARRQAGICKGHEPEGLRTGHA
jgi:hypothetical protein